MDEERAKQAEQLRYIHGLYVQEYEALITTISNYVSASNAISRNLEVINKLNTIKGSEMLLNLEGGTYVKVQAKDTSNVITYVGGGYLVDKTAAEAKEFLDANVKKSEVILSKLNTQKEKLEADLLEAEYKIGMLEQG